MILLSILRGFQKIQSLNYEILEKYATFLPKNNKNNNLCPKHVGKSIYSTLECMSI
jgi:hypothetical protein